MEIKDYIRTIPGFPKPGIMFRDITTLVQDPQGLKLAVDGLEKAVKKIPFDAIAGIEARGFIFGAILADRLKKGLVLARKPGKLPGETKSASYKLEYGTDSLEMHTGSFPAGARVLVVDDLLATGGTLEAVCRLVKDLGGIPVACACVIELPALGGRKRLKDYEVLTLVSFEGD